MLIRTLLISYYVFIVAADSSAMKHQRLFGGETLQGWQISEYSGHGPVYVLDSCIVLETGKTCTGIRWIKEFPKTDYEVTLEAKRTDGSDFFCGMIFPVGEDYSTLIIGGWGGNVVGLSSIDGYDAANNATGQMRILSSNRWYSIRLRVSPDYIEAWIDKDKIVEFEIGGHRLSLRWEMEPFKPFGFATWKTTSMIRNVVVKYKRE
jgi:hypothetical protein